MTDSTAQSALLTTFRFPEAFAGAAKVYLVYFIRFLQDLGLHADFELKDRGQNVSWRVSPISDSDAVPAICKALRIYLDLPSNPTFAAVTACASDVAVGDLRANVLLLQTQFELAHVAEESRPLPRYQLHQTELNPEPSASHREDTLTAPIAAKPLSPGGAPDLIDRLRHADDIDLRDVIGALKRELPLPRLRRH